MYFFLTAYSDTCDFFQRGQGVCMVVLVLRVVPLVIKHRENKEVENRVWMSMEETVAVSDALCIHFIIFLRTASKGLAS